MLLLITRKAAGCDSLSNAEDFACFLSLKMCLSDVEPEASGFYVTYLAVEVGNEVDLYHLW